MSDEIRTIRLYGRLGSKFGRVHKLAVKSAGEAVRALCVLLPGFEAYVTGSQDRGEGYAVFYDQQNLSKDEIHNPMGCAEIRIAPIVLGAKKAGVFQVILGAVLIVVGVLAWFAPPVSAALINAGIALVIGGVIQLLTPAPKGRAAEDRPDNKASAVFNGPINTQAQGNPVQVLYGELIVGSAVVSAGITAEDQAFVPRSGARLGYGGGGGGGSSPWHLEWAT